MKSLSDPINQLFIITHQLYESVCRVDKELHSIMDTHNHDWENIKDCAVWLKEVVDELIKERDESTSISLYEE